MFKTDFLGTSIPWEVVILIVIVPSFLAYRYLNRLMTVSRVNVLLVSKDGLEGRRFIGEDSLAENRISIIKRINWRKTEKIDFKRKYPPMQEYKGSSRNPVYLVYEKDGKNSSWALKTDSSDESESTYEDIAKWKTLKAQLGAEAFAGFRKNMTWIIMGYLMGVITIMMLTLIFPQVF